MKNPFNRQSQFELFPDSPGAPPRKESFNIFGQSFQFSLENLIVAGVIFILAVVVSFSFGIERGRRAKIGLRAKAVVPVVSGQPAEVPQEAVTAIDVKGADQLLAASFVGDSADDAALQQTAAAVVEEGESLLAPEKSIDKTASLETIHTVQVASFKKLNRAEQEVGDLKKLGYEAFTSKKGTYYIVCVGKFSEKQQANALVKPLRKRYSDCYVRRL